MSDEMEPKLLLVEKPGTDNYIGLAKYTKQVIVNMKQLNIEMDKLKNKEVVDLKFGDLIRFRELQAQINYLNDVYALCEKQMLSLNSGVVGSNHIGKVTTH